MLFVCCCFFFLFACRIQELSEDDGREAGRIPRTIECELTSDLVDSCIPGDMVTITAVVKASNSEEGVVLIGGTFCCVQASGDPAFILCFVVL